MSKILYCHVPAGFRCDAAKNGKCTSGHETCPYQSHSPIPPSSITQKDRTDDCNYCIHEKVCSFKAKYKQICKDNYPAVTHCENYKVEDIFKEILLK